jgi:hypothetical protein
MANNDKLRQIVSDILTLKDLTNGMIDAEIYPVSFFSQAFDLMQKIQGDFHKLEADQVELFASQMKKHQALILSIHRQMRHIDASSAEHPASPPAAPKVVPSPATVYPPHPQKKEIAGPEENKQKKVSFLSRIGISKEPEPEASEEAVRKPAVTHTGVTPPPPPVVNTEKPFHSVPPQTIAETPSPVRKQTEVLPGKPASGSPKVLIRKKVETIRPSEAAGSETVKKTAKSTTTIPESAPERITRLPWPGAQTLSGMNKTPETQTANGIPAEGSAPPSVNDAMEKQKLSDLRKAFSLNDRFLYRRELFGGSEEVMNKVITALNSKTSYQECIRFLEEKLHWDFTRPIVKAFIKVLEIRFL